MKKLLLLSLICFTSAHMLGMGKKEKTSVFILTPQMKELGERYYAERFGQEALDAIKNAPEEPTKEEPSEEPVKKEPIEFVWTVGDIERCKYTDPSFYKAELDRICTKKAQARAQFIINTMLPKLLKGDYSTTFFTGKAYFGYFSKEELDIYPNINGFLEERHFESIESQTKKIVAENMQKNWAQKSTKKVKHRKRKS